MNKFFGGHIVAQKPAELPPPVFRLFSDESGHVYLTIEPGATRIEVKRPVTSATLQAARDLLQAEVDSKAEAHKEIQEALDPMRKARWLSKLEYGSNYLMKGSLTMYLTLILVVLFYKGVQSSSTHLPELVHFMILGIYVLGLGVALYLIGTEERRVKFKDKIIRLLGPQGMLILPLLLLVGAGGVLASITIRLYNRGFIALELCSGRPMSEPGLLDFYMWHFVNIVPTLQITKLLRWGEPYCYTQHRVGILILIFQLLVVIPSFNTIRFYWKHRKSAPEFVYDPYWKPTP